MYRCGSLRATSTTSALILLGFQISFLDWHTGPPPFSGRSPAVVYRTLTNALIKAAPWVSYFFTLRSITLITPQMPWWLATLLSFTFFITLSKSQAGVHPYNSTSLIDDTSAAIAYNDNSAGQWVADTSLSWDATELYLGGRRYGSELAFFMIS